MYKYIIETAGDFNWMAVFALITFFFIFSLGAVLAIRSDKKRIDYMARMPLEDDIDNSNTHKN